MNTRVKHTVRVLFVLVLALGLGIAWMLTSSVGLQLLIRTAKSLSGGAVTVQSGDGSLSGGAQLRGIRIKSVAGDVRIDRLSLRCECRLLMLGIVELDRANATGVSVNVSGATGAGHAAGRGPWPVALLIDDLELNNIAVRLPGKSAPQEITHLSTHLLARRGHLALSDLHLTRPRLQIWYNGRIALTAPFHLESRAGWTAVLQDHIPLSGSARLHGDESRLRAQVTLQAPLAAQLSADVREPLGSKVWSVSILSQWSSLHRLAPAFPASVSTRVALKGNGEGAAGRIQGQLDIRQTGNHPPHSARFKVDAALTRGTPGQRLTATLGWEHLNWPFKNLKLASREGALHLNGPLTAPVLTGTNNFTVNGNSGTLTLDAVLNRKGVNLRTGTLTVGNAYMSAHGGVALTPGAPGGDLHLQWRNVSGRLPWLESVRSDQGSADLHGTIDTWKLASSGSLGGKRMPPGQFEVHGSGHGPALTLDNWQLQTLNGAVNGSGRIVLSGRRDFDLQFGGQGFDPGTHWPGWDGKLDVKGFARSAPGGEADFQVGIQGQLRKRAVKLDMDVGASPDTLAIRQMQFSSGSASAAIRGTLGAKMNLSWQVNAPDLRAVRPRMSGSLAGEGQIQGPAGKPEIQGHLNATGIRSPWLDLNELRARADLDLATGRNLQASVKVTGLRRGTSKPADLDIQLHGNADNHQLQVDGSWDKARLAVSGTGSLQGETWRGKLQTISITHADGHSLSLVNPVGVGFVAGQASLEKLCLQGPQSRWCAQGAWTPETGAWSLQSSASAIPLQWFGSALPTTISVEGSAAFDVDATGTGRALQSARGDIALHDAALQFDTGKATPYRLPLSVGSGSMQLKGGDLHASLALNFDNAAVRPLHADLTLSGITAWPLTPSSVRMSGAMSAGADDISFLSTAFPYATDLHGGFQANVKLSGTLNAPHLGGNFSLRDCSFDTPDLGTHIAQFNLKGESVGADRYHVSGALHSGKGVLTISGNINAAGNGGSRLKIHGRQFELVNLPELWALVSPNLDVSWKDGAPFISGRINVPEAKIDLDEAAVKAPVSDDVVLVGPKAEVQQAASPMPGSNVQLVLGKDISVSGRGVTGKLSGALQLTSRPGSDLLADGEIKINDGTYSAYGQSLKIEEGRLLYRHTQLDNPNLSVRAVRTVQDISAGVSVSGYLTQPVVSLFSSPSMSQEETLSYIVFGRPMKNLSSGNGSSLMAAAASLGLQNSGMVTSSLASIFGLNKLQVQAGETTESASLLIGKYLTPRLYLSYGMGLFQTLATGKLRYDLSRHWAIEAERSNEFGVDLLYKIEK